MTYHQFGTLKYIRSHEIGIRECGELSMVTFGSLIKRGWISRTGGFLVLTEQGEEAYNMYSHAQANFRKYDTGLTDHVKDLLHLGSILELTKKRA
jgi:hypothetical protein